MSAQQDAVTAHAAMVLELMIGGLNRVGAEAKVTGYDQVRRAEVLREAADWFDRYDTDSAVQLRRMAERTET